MTAEQKDPRGRESDTPREIPRSGWRDILLRTRDAIGKDYVGLLAAGMAFYALLAIFPGVGAVVSLYGLIANPDTVQQHLQILSGLMPQQAYEILDQQMSRLVGNRQQTLSLAAAGSLLLGLWGATKGVRAFIAAMNIAYGEEEKRGFIKLNLIALALTGFLVVLAVLALVTVLVVPALVKVLPMSSTLNWLITLLRWPAIAAIFVVTLAVLYRFTPSRNDARWSWLSLGSVVAVALWLVASVAFSIYVRNFGSYNETYGSLGAVVALLMWLWLSAYFIIAGAELNAETERQTRHDSTVGKPKPMGERGAYAADTLGEER